MEKSKRLLLNSIFPFIQLTPQYDGPSSPIAGITATSSLYAANDLRRWLVLATVHEIPPTFLGQVLEAFASWLRLRRGISPSVLASHPLAHTALSSLSSEIISEASVNVVSELIHCSAVGNSSDTTMQLPLIQIIVPQVMNLRPLLSDRPKIFLIERDLYLSFGSEASIEAEKNRRLLIFRPAYETLVSLVSFRVQYPDDYMELSREDIKDFKQTRYEILCFRTGTQPCLPCTRTTRPTHIERDKVAKNWTSRSPLRVTVPHTKLVSTIIPGSPT